MREKRYDELSVSVADTPDELATTAADEFARAVTAALAERQTVSVVLATGNSQLSFAEHVTARDDIDWSRISLFHMDEYRGMPADHPASFRRWMREQVVAKVPLRAFHPIEGDREDVSAELARYAGLLRAEPPTVVVMGIGENGHLAFNDPPADFGTEELIHLVQLDEDCRMQQVGEGHFASLDETPTEALSLTVPMLISPPIVLVVAPERRKAEAVRAALEGPVTEAVPASILRRVPQARLLLDAESAALLSP
jgi:glucosamine-6-phosphate deaminase